jgi:uncharacterized protein Usg
MVKGYGLTTAHIEYRKPGSSRLVIEKQDFLWQTYDLFPDFPRLSSFLKYWEERLRAPILGVTVAHSKLIKPTDFKVVAGVFRLN